MRRRDFTKLAVAGAAATVAAPAVVRAQTTLDPRQMREWIPNSNYGAHAFCLKGDPGRGLTPFAEFFARRETLLPWIAEYSPYALVTADDPPVFLGYHTPPALGQKEEDPTHTANFGVKLQEHCKSLGVPCELVYPGAPELKHAPMPDLIDYLIATLKAPAAK